MKGAALTVLLLAAMAAIASAQPRDAGPDGGRDTTLAGDGGADAGADADAAPLTVAERGLVIEQAEAERDRREAEEAREQALADQRRARSEAELALSTARAELEDIRAHQARFQSRLVRDKAAASATATEHKKLHRDLATAAAAAAGHDALYDRVAAALARARVETLRDVLLLFGDELASPRPRSRLDQTVTRLPVEFAAEVASLDQLRHKLIAKADDLDSESRRTLSERVAIMHDATARLNQLRVALLAEVSASKRQRLRGFSEETAMELRGEALQVALDVAYWFHTRATQLSGVELHVDDLSRLVALTSSVLWILLILVALRFSVRRWDDWMRATVAMVGQTAHLGGWTLFFARLAELARGFGPALLVVVTTLIINARLGGDRAVAEVRIGFIFIFWMALFRCQLRLFEGLARYLGNRASERARQRHEDSRVEEAAGEFAALPIELPSNDQESAWSLVVRSWRLATRYTAVVVILRELTEFAVGAGVFHAIVGRVAWWGVIGLAIVVVRQWRVRIVDDYMRRSQGRGFLARIVEHHSPRFYGVVILVPALLLVLAGQVVAFVKDNLSNLEATKRFFAFTFRRRVEKQGQQRGWVVDKPHELPQAIIDECPVGALSAEQRPVRPELVEAIKQAHDTWVDEHGRGSLALVGSSGLGKTTVLFMLERELGCPVTYARVSTKIIRPHQLLAFLAETLALPAEPASEAELVELIHAGEHRVLAIDDCHNLFLRQVGGFDAWEAFTRIVNETCDSVFWIGAFNDIAWDYLSDIADGVAYFRKVIKMPGWSDEELRRLLLTRVRRAGFRPSFTDLLVTRLEGVKMSTQIIGTSQAYFRLLWDFTDGNPRDANHFWLRSLVPEDERKRVRVHLFSAPRVDELQKLPDDMIFVLAAVVEHEEVNVAEVAAITNMSAEYCRLAMRFCREAGYLWRDAATGRTHLSIHWRQTIIRLLRRRHLLYS